MSNIVNIERLRDQCNSCIPERPPVTDIFGPEMTWEIMSHLEASGSDANKEVFINDPEIEELPRPYGASWGHDPLPAVALNGRWDVVRANAGAERLFSDLLTLLGRTDDLFAGLNHPRMRVVSHHIEVFHRSEIATLRRGGCLRRA